MMKKLCRKNKIVIEDKKIQAKELENKKIENSLGNELLAREVLTPLLNVIFEYRTSEAYNIAPDSIKIRINGRSYYQDEWDYYEKAFNDIYVALDKNIFITDEVYNNVKSLIDDLKAFVRSYSYTEGLSDKFFIANPNLNYFRVAFELQEELRGADYYELKKDERLRYISNEKAFLEKEKYFFDKFNYSEEKNFKQVKEDFFMQELSYATRVLFKNIIQ